MQLGCDHHWYGSRGEDPYLVTKDGRRIEISVENFVPCIYECKSFGLAAKNVGSGKPPEDPAPTVSETSQVVPKSKAKHDALDTRVEASADESWHLMTHRCKLSNCKACQLGSMQRTPARVQYPATRPTKFGEQVCGDTLVVHGISAGFTGEEYACVLLDRGTGWLGG